jgi:hypothetical protein
MSNKMAGKQEAGPLEEESISPVRAKKRTSPGIRKRRQQRKLRYSQLDCIMKEISQLLDDTYEPQPPDEGEPSRLTDE